LAAQRCYVGAAARNGATLIVSILGSRDLWGDSRKLLEYGLENYETLKANAPVTTAFANGKKPSSPLFSSAEERQLQSAYGYLLQIASFRERDRADSLQKVIAASGVQAAVEPAPLPTGETTYRVKVGPYAKLTDAQEAAREIETKSGFRAIILPAAN
jgi:cell division septation protein DedD